MRLLSELKFRFLLISIFAGLTGSFFGSRSLSLERFDPVHCQSLFQSKLTMITGDIKHPVKYLITEGPLPGRNTIQTQHLQAMLGQFGQRVDVALYKEANSILFLSDGAETRKIDRLGPVLAKEFPKKTIVSADINIVEDGFVNNWGLVKIDNLKKFPIADDSFDRVILKKGLCLCHGDTCCGGFKPRDEATKQFFGEVARVLNKKDPNAIAVLQGTNNVGMSEILKWNAFMDEVSKKYPVEYEFMYDREGLFHSILIQPRFTLHSKP